MTASEIAKQLNVDKVIVNKKLAEIVKDKDNNMKEIEGT